MHTEPGQSNGASRPAIRVHVLNALGAQSEREKKLKRRLKNNAKNEKSVKRKIIAKTTPTQQNRVIPKRETDIVGQVLRE